MMDLSLVNILASALFGGSKGGAQNSIRVRTGDKLTNVTHGGDVIQGNYYNFESFGQAALIYLGFGGVYAVVKLCSKKENKEEKDRPRGRKDEAKKQQPKSEIEIFIEKVLKMTDDDKQEQKRLLNDLLVLLTLEKEKLIDMHEKLKQRRAI